MNFTYEEMCQQIKAQSIAERKELNYPSASAVIEKIKNSHNSQRELVRTAIENNHLVDEFVAHFSHH